MGSLVVVAGQPSVKVGLPFFGKNLFRPNSSVSALSSLIFLAGK
jgi:hypothetical protein